MKIGTVLEDGQIVLQFKYEAGWTGTLKKRWAVILCLWEGSFVIWDYDTVEEYGFRGDYDNATLEEALKSYNVRGEE